MSTRAVSKSWSLSALKSTQLKYAAFLMGLPSTGRKIDLEDVINEEVASPPRINSAQRILSVDMGIRNLAFCTIDVPEKTSKPWKVQTWRRMDLLQGLSEPIANITEQTDESSTDDTEKSSPKTKVKASIPKDAFTPSSLSKIAYNITKVLLAFHPDTILIERQRFRSGGAAAIQEWTVRVNMLESMIWACTQTLRATHNHDSTARNFPSTHEVNPARVAHFWTASPHVSLRAANDLFHIQESRKAPAGLAKLVERKKIEKADKVNIVREWAAGSAGDVSVEFEGEASHIADVFGGKTTAGGGRRKRDASIGKLDDLADCLLQAGAWARWEENRRQVRRLVTGEHIES